MEYSVAKDLLS